MTMCHSYVGADLAHLVREAALRALERVSSASLAQASERGAGARYEVTADDFSAAMATLVPAATRDSQLSIATVTWEDIGGLEACKARLRQVASPRSRALSRSGSRLTRTLCRFPPVGTLPPLLGGGVADPTPGELSAPRHQAHGGRAPVWPPRLC